MSVASIPDLSCLERLSDQADKVALLKIRCSCKTTESVTGYTKEHKNYQRLPEPIRRSNILSGFMHLAAKPTTDGMVR